ncbi:Uncharacterised protein [Mesomycoplasma conjunctivae]|uniref:Uncharacterized protein n=1 Tax=Mesomycoplasma conjunctivae (strain ATCC 25834 / NCTC 10147 / HRC/581) TaxID=572263 RepID=C5J725_MESCH|nr:hypothetical protein [Mesomycoplasma conjunctivae]CAT05288.1 HYPOTHETICAL PROTEIN MCJ_005910 [Mesomycoplasma conjunctivae]VEU66517.1 Uncharacterised protein [Mesomycoplasma conjunctivae]
MKTTISLISQILFDFNNTKSLENQVNLVIKGSYIFDYNETSELEPKDLDFCFTNSTRMSVKQKFIEYLNNHQSFEIVKQDDNLCIFSFNNINLEFILLEEIPLDYLEKTDFQFIKIIQKNFAIIQKILAFSYINSRFFPHNRQEKLTRSLSQLQKWVKQIDKNTIFSNQALNFLQTCLWNSFFIFEYYNYDKMLVIILDELNMFETFVDTKYAQIIHFIKSFYDFFLLNKDIDKMIKIMNKLLAKREEIKAQISSNYHKFFISNFNSEESIITTIWSLYKLISHEDKQDLKTKLNLSPVLLPLNYDITFPLVQKPHFSFENEDKNNCIQTELTKYFISVETINKDNKSFKNQDNSIFVIVPIKKNNLDTRVIFWKNVVYILFIIAVLNDDF